MRLRWLLYMLGVPALLVLAGSAYFAEGSLRRPARPSKDAVVSSAERQELILHAADGTELHAWFIHPPKGQTSRCTMLLHGIADSRNGVAGFAPLFLEAGDSVLLPDSRGHGRSGGEFVTYGLIEKQDVREWVSWMQLRGCRQVYGLGESLGAAVLLQAAVGEPGLRAIFAECSFTDLKSIAEYRVAQRLRGPSWLSTALAKLIVGGGLVYARLR